MKKIIDIIRKNLFLMCILLIYILLFLTKPSLALHSLQNSGYYIKEMLMIMPAIFVLTALLDTWVPKEVIIKFLGKSSGKKGIFFSFVLGSVSAGPIYAAFPVCVMLHKKGASIQNIIIILSSWAVIKIPMLLNEAKFLGLRFMGTRWLLTVLSIFIFSWIASRFIKDEDIIEENASVQTGAFINSKACIGCSLCAKKYPQLFEMHHNKAVVKNSTLPYSKDLEDAINHCPVKAIQYRS